MSESSQRTRETPGTGRKNARVLIWMEFLAELPIRRLDLFVVGMAIYAQDLFERQRLTVIVQQWTGQLCTPCNSLRHII